MELLEMIENTDSTTAMIVGIEDETFAIPLSSILTIENIAVSDIKSVDQEDVIYIRENIIPLVHLDKFFRINRAEDSRDRINVVVCGFKDQTFGFVVDTLLGQRDITSKSLGLLSDNEFFSGASILEDEENVALVLNVPSFV